MKYLLIVLCTLLLCTPAHLKAEETDPTEVHCFYPLVDTANKVLIALFDTMCLMVCDSSSHTNIEDPTPEK